MSEIIDEDIVAEEEGYLNNNNCNEDKKYTNGNMNQLEAPTTDDVKASQSNGSHTLSVVEEGDLENIVKPPHPRGPRAPSTQHRTPGTGSRPPGTATSTQGGRGNFRQTWSSIAPSLEILSPEEIMEQEMEDLEIQDFGSSGDDLTDDPDLEDEDEAPNPFFSDMYKSTKSREASSLFHMAEPNIKDESVRGEDDWEGESEYPATRQISLIEKDAASEVDSEEERDILQEIKNEITQQVKAEMKDELALMKRTIEKQSGINEDKNSDLDNLEPDLKMAILKMRKLDRILAKKEKREKEVKRERIMLQARLKKELNGLKPEGREEQKEVKVNTSKYLALTLPPSHNLGIRVTESGDIEEDLSPPVTPLFTTQVPDDGQSRKNKQHKGQESDEEDDDDANSEFSEATTATSAATTGSGRNQSSQKRKKGKKKDFIKRNIQLAAEAGETVAMTDDEKKRISDLLTDINEIPDVVIDDESVMGDNPFQITLSVGEGFHPSHAEIQRLENIDRRLKALLPREDYESIASTPRSLTRQTQQPSVLFTRTNQILDLDLPGEVALKETKEHRDLSQRLKDVENQLKALTSTEHIQGLDGRLSEQQLDHLLDDCVRSLSSQRTMETPDDFSRISSRQTLLEHPPHLPTDVLQQLLADARQAEIENGWETPEGGAPRDTAPVIESHTDQQTLLSTALQEVQQHFSDNSSTRPSTQLSSRPSTGDSRPSTQHSVNYNGPSNQYNGLGSNYNVGPGMQHSSNGHTGPSNQYISSRPSTGDTLTNVSRPGTGQSGFRESFLPAIDPKGSLMSTSTTKAAQSSNSSVLNSNVLLNSNSRPNSRPKMKNVWNSVSDTDGSVNNSLTTDSSVRSVVPHPPSSGGKKNKKGVTRKDSGYLVEDLE